jgi:acetyltransferase-like isoleucine patch superfamily enzyme
VRGLLRRASYSWGPRIASAARKRWLIWRHPHVDIRFEGPVYLGPGFSLFCPEGGTFHVGPWVEFRRDFRAELHKDATIRIGGGTVFTYSVVLQCSSTIEIGERCMLAQSVMVVDGSHRFRDLDRPVLEQGYDLRPIRIGDDASVMAKTTVIADVGERAFVGANSVVTRPVPPYTVAAGVPARVIEELRPPSPA